MVDVSLRHKSRSRPSPRRQKLRDAGRRFRLAWRHWHTVALIVILAIVAVAIVGYAILQFVVDDGPSGRTDDPRPVAFVVAGEKFAIPANMLRSPAGRHAGTVDKVDLVLHWPGLGGYSKQLADAFRDDSPNAPLLFVSIMARDSPIDSDARLDTVYSRFFVGTPLPGPGGLVGRRLSDDSGYRGEIVYFVPAGEATFVARCFAEATAEMPATCLRDVNIGNNLSMLYRFSRDYLGDWAAIDARLRRLAAGFLAAG